VAEQYLVDDHVVLVVEPVAPGEAESPAVKAGPLPSDQEKRNLEPRTVAGGPDWSKMPDPSARGNFSPPGFTTHRLSNGVEVRIVPWTTLPLVTARLLVNAGSADTTLDRAGLASLTARLWDKGTDDLTATELTEALDALGTSLNVAAGADTTQLSFTVEKLNLGKTLKLVGDVITQPRFDSADFEREKKLHLSALTSGTDSPSWIAQRVFTGLLYGKGHPYSLPSMGFTSSVRSITLDQIKDFYRRHFVPENATLIVVGDVEASQLMTMLEEALGNWKSDTQVTPRRIPDKKAPGGTVYVVDKPGSVQSVITVGRVWRGRKDDTYFAARVGNRVLGGDFLSRINQNLRERNGYTYGARSGFQFRRVGGEWTVTTSVRSDVTGAAVREIIHELDALRGNRPLSAEEVRMARNAELNVFPQSFETPANIAAVLSQLAIYDLNDEYLTTYASALAGTPEDDVDQVMRQLVEPDARTILVVGDRQSVVPQLKEVGFDNIRYINSDGQEVGDEVRKL
jgi:zinc protease